MPRAEMQTMLLDAIRQGDRRRVHELVTEDGGLVEARAASGESAVLLAVYHGHDAMAADLIQAGASTDLHEAAALGLTERVWAWLERHPAELDGYSFDGWTALHLAAGARSDLLARNPQANLPLHAATAGRHPEIIQLLLAHGADVNATTAQGWTALHLAAHAGDLRLVEVFLGHGARAGERNAEGKSALDLAIEQGRHAVAERLRQVGRLA